jgi:hypothetical protein
MAIVVVIFGGLAIGVCMDAGAEFLCHGSAGNTSDHFNIVDAARTA